MRQLALESPALTTPLPAGAAGPVVVVVWAAAVVVVAAVVGAAVVGAAVELGARGADVVVEGVVEVVEATVIGSVCAGVVGAAVVGTVVVGAAAVRGAVVGATVVVVRPDPTGARVVVVVGASEVGAGVTFVLGEEVVVVCSETSGVFLAVVGAPVPVVGEAPSPEVPGTVELTFGTVAVDLPVVFGEERSIGDGVRCPEGSGRE